MRTLNTKIKVSTKYHSAYFKTKKGVLFNCDCMDLLTSMKDYQIDTIFADPPFNLGKDYGTLKISDNLREQEYLLWCYSWLNECIRILKPGGALFVYNIPKWLYMLASYLDDKLHFRHWIALSMKSTYPRGKKLYPAHYGIIYFTKGDPKTFNRVRLPVPVCRHCGKELKDYGGHRNALNPEGLNLTDLWEDTSPCRHRKYKYRVSNELKVMIPERAILISTNPNDLVLDPFGGGGSTYQAAEKNQRFWVGSEIGNCEAIVERMTDLSLDLIKPLEEEYTFDFSTIFKNQAEDGFFVGG